MSIIIIVNPVSGRGTDSSPTGEARVRIARGLAERAPVPIDVIVTTGPGHAADLSRLAVERGDSRVIAWGGDGTVNEAAGPLLGTPIILGIVPAGSGDGLARGLGLPRSLDEAFAAAVGERVTRVDVGMLGARHFLNIAGIGFDAAVAEAFNRRTTRGSRGYLIEFLRGLWTFTSDTYATDAAGARVEGPCFAIAFANCREYSSGLVLAPHANPTDGQLEMVMVAGGASWRQLWRARRLAWRRLAPAEGVRRASITSATVSGDRLRCHVDGQTFETSGTLKVAIKPKALLVAGVNHEAVKQ